MEPTRRIDRMRWGCPTPLLLVVVAAVGAPVARGQVDDPAPAPGASTAADLPAPLGADEPLPEDELPPLPPGDPSPATPASLGSDPGAPLVPGQVVMPIDLASALRLAGARDLDIAIARERVAEALGALQLARSAWLPSFS